MRLPYRIRQALLERAARVMARQAPDFIIGDNYLRRWWIIPRNRWVNVYLHEFRADDDRALHDHPWASCSILLSGWYLEHVLADPRDPAGPTIDRVREWGFWCPKGWRPWQKFVARIDKGQIGRGCD